LQGINGSSSRDGESPSDSGAQTPNNIEHQSSTDFLGPQQDKFVGRKTLVLDLDETLVNSNVVEDYRSDQSDE
jgi:TFIIF-interacting CTD phosphatase-like protein